MKNTSSSESSPAKLVSKKAYAGFVDRISSVFSNPRERAEMLRALDRYLEGDFQNFDRYLNSECRMAFAMLLFDIDAAIERSARARERAAKRKAAKEALKNVSHPEVTVNDAVIYNLTHAGDISTDSDDSPSDIFVAGYENDYLCGNHNSAVP